MTASSGPLAGVRVVELAGIGPGPYAGMLLAELGADVIRVDRPLVGEPPVDDRFDLLRRSRPSVEVDLRTREGVEAVLALVAEADVLIEGNRPGVTERLGVGPDDCWNRNRRLVYGRVTGWGQQGPLASTAGHDLNYLAVSGALHLIGPYGQPPTVPGVLVGDFAGGGLFLVIGILAAVLEARQSGQGQVVDAAIVDGAASLIALQHGLRAGGFWSDQRGNNLLDGGVPWYSIYRTMDDRWLSVAAIEPKFFVELCRLLPLDASEEDRADPTRWPDLRTRISTRVAERTLEEWSQVFGGTDACVAPVLSLDEATRDAHLTARSTYVEVDGIGQPAPAPRFSRTATEIRRVDDVRRTVEWAIARWRP